MPKSIANDLRKLTKVIHPKSRKTQQLTKKISRISAREKIKLIHQVRQNLLGEKLQWFKDHLNPDAKICTPHMLLELIELYLRRFDEELEQISLKRSVGAHRSRQHANREDIIRMTVLKDQEEFETGGIELPDILAVKQMELLRMWQGELRFLQKFRLRRFSRQALLAACAQWGPKEAAEAEAAGSNLSDRSNTSISTEESLSALSQSDEEGRCSVSSTTDTSEEHMETDT